MKVKSTISVGYGVSLTQLFLFFCDRQDGDDSTH